MRRLLSILLITIAAALGTATAQKYACVNTDYVLKSIPDYAAAQKRINKYVSDWSAELQAMTDELEQMRAEYEQESYLLPEGLKRRRQEELKEKELAIRTLQKQRFGPEGDLEKKRAELMGPVQDRVYNAIERVAHEKNYAFVFDRAGSSTLLFVNKKYDISDDVLELLGYKPGAAGTPPPGADDKARSRPTNPEMRNQDPNTPPPLSGRKR